MTVIALPQRVYYAVYDTANSMMLADDQANHTLTFCRDGTNFTPSNAPTNVANGVYEVVLTDAERVGEVLVITGVSSTPDTIIQPIAQAAEVRLAGMTYPSPTTPTLASFTTDAQALLSQHVTDVGVTITDHGDSGPWTTGASSPSDWTFEERGQMRLRLGIDGAEPTAPAVRDPDLALEATAQAIDSQTKKLQFTVIDTDELLQIDVKAWQGDELTEASMIADDGSGNSQWTAIALALAPDYSSGVQDVNLVEIMGSADRAQRHATNIDTIVPATVTAATTPSPTVFSVNLADSAPDHYKNRAVIFTSGNNKNAASKIVDYTTGLITVAGFPQAPTVNDTLIIV